MRELVGCRIAGQHQIRLVRLDDVLGERARQLRPVQALFDVGLLADDARLEHGEVGGRRAWEALGDVVLEVPGEAGRPRPGRPGGDGAGDRGVEEPHLLQVRAQALHLHQESGGLALERAAGDRHLDVRGLTLAEVRHRRRTVLVAREQHSVVVAQAVVRTVVEVGVQAVLVLAGVEHAHAHLLRRAVARRDVRPAGGRGRARPAGRARCRRSPPASRTAARTTG